MINVYDYLLKNYGYNEPIFTSDLKKNIDIKPNTFRQTIKRLSDKALIIKVAKGIYFIPNKKSVLKKPMLSIDKLVIKKFLNSQDDVVGYKTGINFSNSLGLTSQTASIPTIVTNNTSSNKREVSFYNKKIIIRKPRTQINAQNYKILQVLDLVKDFERLSEEPLNKAKYKILDYLIDVKISEDELKKYLDYYPNETKIKMYESGLYYEIASR